MIILHGKLNDGNDPIKHASILRRQNHPFLTYIYVYIVNNIDNIVVPFQVRQKLY